MRERWPSFIPAFIPYLRRLRASQGSLDVLNELLEYDGCDVDYINKLEGATPLHLAVKLEEPELRALIVDSLLDAGADPRFALSFRVVCVPPPTLLTTACSIKDKAGSVAKDYVLENDTETRNAFRRYQAQASYSKDDVANGA